MHDGDDSTVATDSGSTAPELTYGSYLMVEELLELQQLQSDPVEHDETLFIIIHQVYELWFKQVLHELDRVVELLAADDPVRPLHGLKRVRTILKTLVAQLDVLETMTPLEFASFRSFLANSSGFQSAQFRELETVLGLGNESHLANFEGAPRARIERRLNEPTLWDCVLGLLERQGLTGDEELDETLISLYRTDPECSALFEALVDVDEGLQEWRYRHVMMVMRTIGTKPGTGGSDGAAYLRSTLFRPAFPLLWDIRSRF